MEFTDLTDEEDDGFIAEDKSEGTTQQGSEGSNEEQVRASRFRLLLARPSAPREACIRGRILRGARWEGRQWCPVLMVRHHARPMCVE